MQSLLHSLRFRLFLVTIIVSVLSIGALALFSSRITILKFQQYVASDTSTNLDSAGANLAAYYTHNHMWAGVETVLDSMGKIAGKQFILVDTERRLIGTSGGSLSQGQIEVSAEDEVTVNWNPQPSASDEKRSATKLRLRNVSHHRPSENRPDSQVRLTVR